jgi:hypothetical protein
MEKNLTQLHTLFICYSRKDLEQIKELVECVRAGGYNPWFDKYLTPGQDWKHELKTIIQGCDAFVYAITSDSLTSEWCQWELHEAAKMGKPIFPVLFQTNLEIPKEIASLQWVDFSEGRPASAVSNLMRGLQVATTIPSNSIPDAPRDPEGTPSEAFVSADSSKNLQISKINGLAKDFDFTLEELELNRKGKISERQSEKLKQNFYHVLKRIVFISAICAIFTFLILRLLIKEQSLIMPPMFAGLIFVMMLTTISKSIYSRSVKSTAGIIIAADLYSITINSLKISTGYRSSVFPTQEKQPLICYYVTAPKSRRLLSIEPASATE